MLHWRIGSFSLALIICASNFVCVCFVWFSKDLMSLPWMFFECLYLCASLETCSLVLLICMNVVLKFDMFIVPHPKDFAICCNIRSWQHQRVLIAYGINSPCNLSWRKLPCALQVCLQVLRLQFQLQAWLSNCAPVPPRPAPHPGIVLICCSTWDIFDMLPYSVFLAYGKSRHGRLKNSDSLTKWCIFRFSMPTCIWMHILFGMLT